MAATSSTPSSLPTLRSFLPRERLATPGALLVCVLSGAFLLSVWSPFRLSPSALFPRLFPFTQHVPASLHFLRPRLVVDAIMNMLRRDSKAFTEPEASRQMVHLKTKEECRLGSETVRVWTVELPSKHAEGVLRVVKDNVPDQDAIDLQHLRRFAKPKYLPPHVLEQRDLVPDLYVAPSVWGEAPPVVMQAPLSTAWEYSNPSRARAAAHPPTLHLLICASSVISLKDLYALLLQHPPFCSSSESWAYPLAIKEVVVPRLAPTSPAQAEVWSEQFWPTFYRKTNPFGAHPAQILKAEKELQEPEDDPMSIVDAMQLAEEAGDQARRRGLGVGTGCVILERLEGRTEIVAVAGDARYKPQPNEALANSEMNSNACNGNVMGHAVMRAVGMVARKRLRVASVPVTKAAAKAESNFKRGGLEHNEEARDAFFLDTPVTLVESEHYAKDNLKPDGYLCLRLEIILTHEPCIMCSMALVHSRVGRVIFAERMPKTGGLTAEITSNESGPVGLGYGLCWRKELNWQFMCWEYIPDTEVGTTLRSRISNAPTHTLMVMERNGVDQLSASKPERREECSQEKYRKISFATPDHPHSHELICSNTNGNHEIALSNVNAEYADTLSSSFASIHV